MPRVLLIEDDKTMLSLLKILLELEGYEILPLDDDSEEGILDSVISLQPDLVLMDVNLRQASGLKVLERIRQQENGSDVRILMSSGMDYRIECKQAGANDFLQKPYMPEDLVDAIQRVMNHKIGN